MKWIIGFASVLMAVIAYCKSSWRRPWPTESDYSHRVNGYWQLYYASKYFSIIRKPERNKGLEKLFSETKKAEYTSLLKDSHTVCIKAVGDLMMRKELNDPSSQHLWDDVKEYLFDADLTAANFEFAVNPHNVVTKLLQFSVSEDYTDAFMKRTSPGFFDIFFLANNHINDTGKQGIIETCNFLEKNNRVFVGANRTPEEVDAFPIIEKKGIKIAFLSYTFSTNDVPLDEGFEFGTNLIRFNALRDKDYDPSLIKRHIALARKRGADMIVVSNHWGIEFEYYPSSRLVNRAQELMEWGVDVIIGHHPHILNYSQWYQAKDGRNCFCAYSLGNFTAWALKLPIQKLAAILEVEIEKGVDESGKTVSRLKDVSMMPTYFIMNGYGKNADYRVVPLFETLEKIQNGHELEYVSKRDKKVLKKLEQEFNTFLRQDKALTYK